MTSSETQEFPVRLGTSCQQVVSNLLTNWDKQREHNMLTLLLNCEILTCVPFISISWAKNQQANISASTPHRKMSKEIRQHHPNASLDILESKILPVCPTVSFKLRYLACDGRENGQKCTHYRVDFDV